MRSVALKIFSDQFKGDKTFTVAGVLEGISTGKYALSFDDREQKDTGSLITAIKKAMPYISAVVRSPKVVLRGKFELKRAETASSLTPAGIRETIRDVRLWKNHNGKIRPSDVYDTENIEELNIYENRVIKALIDRAIRIVSYDAERSSAEIKTLRSAHVQYGKVNKIDLVRMLGGRQFLSPSKVQHSEYVALSQLKKSLLRLRNSPFYEEMERYPAFDDVTVELTDVFFLNENYSKCYDLWRELNLYERSSASLTPEQRQSAYCAYVSLALINSYKKLGYALVKDGGFKGVTNGFVLNGAVMQRGGLIVTLRAVPERIEVLVQCPSAGVQQRISIGVYADDGLPDDINNQYIVTLNDKKYADTTLCVRPDVPDSLGNIDALARLTVFTHKVGAGVYNNICPVCGKTDVTENGLSCTCADCGAVWIFTDPETIWLSHFHSYGIEEE